MLSTLQQRKSWRARSIHGCQKPKSVWLGVPGHDRPADVASSRPIGLIVGRMASAERLKGHDSMMDAWPEICAEVPDAKLVIVGTGTMKNGSVTGRLKKSSTGLSSGVMSPTKAVIAFTSKPSVYPSKQEGFGLAAAEAASFGLPVLGLAGTVTEDSSRPGLARFWREVSPNPISSNL